MDLAAASKALLESERSTREQGGPLTPSPPPEDDLAYVGKDAGEAARASEGLSRGRGVRLPELPAARREAYSAPPASNGRRAAHSDEGEVAAAVDRVRDTLPDAFPPAVRPAAEADIMAYARRCAAELRRVPALPEPRLGMDRAGGRGASCAWRWPACAGARGRRRATGRRPSSRTTTSFACTRRGPPTSSSSSGG